MTTMIRAPLKSGINRTMDDNRCLEITRATIEGYGESQWTEIMAALHEWQAAGYLAIVKDPRDAAMDEICVLMKKHIETTSPWPDWP